MNMSNDVIRQKSSAKNELRPFALIFVFSFLLFTFLSFFFFFFESIAFKVKVKVNLRPLSLGPPIRLPHPLRFALHKPRTFNTCKNTLFRWKRRTKTDPVESFNFAPHFGPCRNKTCLTTFFVLIVIISLAVPNSHARYNDA